MRSGYCGIISLCHGLSSGSGSMTWTNACRSGGPGHGLIPLVFTQTWSRQMGTAPTTLLAYCGGFDFLNANYVAVLMRVLSGTLAREKG